MKESGKVKLDFVNVRKLIEISEKYDIYNSLPATLIDVFPTFKKVVVLLEKYI
jgi:hypothetical protein